MKTYDDNVLKEEIAAPHFLQFKNGHCFQHLVAGMPDDQALVEWEVHTLEDRRSNDNHQCAINYWSQDIIKIRTWLMRQPAFAEHDSHAAQGCINSDTPWKCIHTEMHTADL